MVVVRVVLGRDVDRARPHLLAADVQADGRPCAYALCDAVACGMEPARAKQGHRRSRPRRGAPPCAHAYRGRPKLPETRGGHHGPKLYWYWNWTAWLYDGVPRESGMPMEPQTTFVLFVFWWPERHWLKMPVQLGTSAHALPSAFPMHFASATPTIQRAAAAAKM